MGVKQPLNMLKPSPQVGPHTVYVFWTISVGPTLTPIYKVAM